ncbi:hypothetical protein GW17_00015605, partial [Ensete ventricosum]
NPAVNKEFAGARNYGRDPRFPAVAYLPVQVRCSETVPPLSGFSFCLSFQMHETLRCLLCLLVPRTGRTDLAHQPFFCGAGILEESPSTSCLILGILQLVVVLVRITRAAILFLPATSCT